MVQRLTYEQLEAYERELLAELETIPEFQDWQALRRLMDRERPHIPASDSDTLIHHSRFQPRKDILTTDQQRQRILAAADEYFIRHSNEPAHLQAVLDYITSKGIEVGGKKPLATVGALFWRDPEGKYVKTDEKRYLWALREDYYAALKKRVA